MKASTGKSHTYMRTDKETAKIMSRLALYLFNKHKRSHQLAGINRPSSRVATAFCLNLASPELKRLGIELTPDNNVWLKIRRVERELAYVAV